jgi:hypothetical protein
MGFAGIGKESIEFLNPLLGFIFYLGQKASQRQAVALQDRFC